MENPSHMKKIELVYHTKNSGEEKKLLEFPVDIYLRFKPNLIVVCDGIGSNILAIVTLTNLMFVIKKD